MFVILFKNISLDSDYIAELKINLNNLELVYPK